MIEFKSVDEILDYAIAREEEAAKFYTDLSGKMDRSAMEKVFKDFAKEEWGHKAKLMDIKKGKALEPVKNKVLDLKIAEFVEDVEMSGEFNYQKALILAMKREKSAFKMYSDLAKSTDNAGVRDIFLMLAQEEAKHKLFFEVEYDENYLAEN
jgi:rubrerythrin